MNEAFIVKLKNIRAHSNADRLKVATVFENNVIVDINSNENDLYIYFPSDLQLGEEFCNINNLVRRKDENGNDCGGYLDPVKRYIRPLKLRGEISDGLIMPLSSVSTFGNISLLKEGDSLNIFNGHSICNKYIPAAKNGNVGVNQPKVKKAKKVELPFFPQHIDTPQLKYCPNLFKENDLIILTEKCHGTSARIGNTVVKREVKTWLQKLLNRKGTMQSKYELMSGTRRVDLTNMTAKDGFYGDNSFRVKWHSFFDGKLQKGEMVYGEIVGATGPNSLIMPAGNNKTVKDKELVKLYGDKTIYSYGCDIEKGENRFFIYRMTKTDEDGNIIEYPFDLLKLRAEQMGAEVVPEFERFLFTTQEDLVERVNKYLNGCSIIDSRHTREGVVIRANNYNGFKVAKIKSWYFSVLEGLIKEEATEADMEESQE